MKWNGEDGEVCKFKGAAHGAPLHIMAGSVDQARAGEGFDVVEDDGYTRAGGFQHAKDAGKFPGEAAGGPGEGGVLDENPSIAPRLRLKLQSAEGLAPAVNFPGHAANLHLKIMRL